MGVAGKFMKVGVTQARGEGLTLLPTLVKFMKKILNLKGSLEAQKY